MGIGMVMHTRIITTILKTTMTCKGHSVNQMDYMMQHVMKTVSGKTITFVVLKRIPMKMVRWEVIVVIIMARTTMIYMQKTAMKKQCYLITGLQTGIVGIG